MKVIETHIVPEGIGDIRLQDYAPSVFVSISSHQGMKKAIKKGMVFVDGVVAKTGLWVESGQRIEMCDLELPPAKVYELQLEVIYEDEHIAVINKPAGISVSGNLFRTVQNTLPFNLKLSSCKDVLRVFRPVHRLDNPTCGLLLIAKTSQAIGALGVQFEKRIVSKRYTAVVIGSLPDKGMVDMPVDGKDAVSSFQVIRRNNSIRNQTLNMVDLFPKTGRTHQLRIHMAGMGTPILGDKLYGSEGEILRKKGLFLCATGLQFYHPFTNEKMDISINPPYKFGRFMEMEEKRWKRYKEDLNLV
ncbi:RluA family pseudouridine synthase [Labilibaculum sp. K2S]|uniref:RluA family pseudouridine synthase n=1 Tax=Labilibaculum sp. K2S TaxID=3056386 RepID=UPI0025A379E9|nr:RluA family pseudouridine synthase [Labilibaculum sp. K2S]MDM8159095.1 RluA family pseudouridine synthase [Labilibaculum sp. K2S]